MRPAAPERTKIARISAERLMDTTAAPYHGTRKRLGFVKGAASTPQRGDQPGILGYVFPYQEKNQAGDKNRKDDHVATPTKEPHEGETFGQKDSSKIDPKCRTSSERHCFSQVSRDSEQREREI